MESSLSSLSTSNRTRKSTNTTQRNPPEMPQSQGFSARRKDFIKSIKAKAHSEGKIFKVALEEEKSTKAAKSVLLGYTRNEDAELYQRDIKKSRGQTTAVDYDADELRLSEDDVYDFNVDQADVDSTDFKHNTNMTVTLLDIAKPAKPRGVAKDFEIIPKPRNNNDDFEVWEEYEYEKWQAWDDDWEEVYDERRAAVNRPSYSSVLRGVDDDKR